MSPLTINDFFMTHANRGLRSITIHDPADSTNLLDLSLKQFTRLTIPFQLAGQNKTYIIQSAKVHLR